MISWAIVIWLARINCYHKLISYSQGGKNETKPQNQVDIVQTVPSGVVVFFASYKQETMFYEMFKKSGFLQQIENVKTLFREPKETAGVAPLLEKYEMSVRVRGAILFAVVGGKVSEGINFSDGLCRAVIMIGVPYPGLYNHKHIFLRFNLYS